MANPFYELRCDVQRFELIDPDQPAAMHVCGAACELPRCPLRGRMRAPPHRIAAGVPRLLEASELE